MGRSVGGGYSRATGPRLRTRELPLAGARLIEMDPSIDKRGSFARMYSRQQFADWGIRVVFEEWSISANHKAGTLRGLHYQHSPHTEAKLVWCAAGSAYDVIVDVRSSSETYGKWIATELRPAGPILYVPPGLAHGFQTREDNTLIQYHIAGAYRPEAATGICWNDAKLNIPWPFQPPTEISDRDRALSTLPSGGKGPVPNSR